MALKDLFVRRPSQDPERPEDAARRAARIPTPDLPSWAEQCIFEIGKNLQHYGRTNEDLALDNAEYAAQGLLAIIAEMKRRHVDWNV